MKKIQYILLFLVLFIAFNSYSQSSEKEKRYIQKDTSYISELIASYNISCSDFFEKLEIPYSKCEDIGFGYQITDSGKGLGSISFQYQILYFNNEVIAYNIETEIGEDKPERIKKIYKEKLSKLFNVEEDYMVNPINSNIDKFHKALIGTEKINDENFKELMNPLFSRTYGTFCGEGSTILKNRKLFDKNISVSNCEYLLYSMNPATRIMAIEFYYSNKPKFNKNQQKKINSRIALLKKEPLIIETCSGCILSGKSSIKIIEELKNSR